MSKLKGEYEAHPLPVYLHGEGSKASNFKLPPLIAYKDKRSREGLLEAVISCLLIEYFMKYFLFTTKYKGSYSIQ